MAYTSRDFQTKAELKRAVKRSQGNLPKDQAGEDAGLDIFSPGPFPTVQNGETTIEGPQYPAPHRWYARVRVVAGRVVEVLS